MLLALLVMSGVLIVGASLGTVSILNLRQARAVDDAVSAFAAAESGAEQTLYQLRRAGSTITSLNAEADDGSDPVLSGPEMANASSWSRVVTGTETTIFTSIPENRSYEVVLWDPEAPNSPAGVESMTFSWDDSCGGTSALEVISAGWDPSSGGGFTGRASIHGDSPAFTFLHADPYVIDNFFDSTWAYRVRLRAKGCDIYNLAINAYSAPQGLGSQVGIPSRVSVTVNGTYGSARQAVELKLPRLQPLSGIFDYVVFSQCSLLKGVSGVPCP